LYPKQGILVLVGSHTYGLVKVLIKFKKESGKIIGDGVFYSTSGKDFQQIKLEQKN